MSSDLTAQPWRLTLPHLPARPQTGESILRLVNLLKREESAATLADAEDDGQGEASGEKSADQKAIDELIGAEDVKQNGGDDGDDDDMVIEEL